MGKNPERTNFLLSAKTYEKTAFVLVG